MITVTTTYKSKVFIARAENFSDILIAMGESLDRGIKFMPNFADIIFETVYLIPTLVGATGKSRGIIHTQFNTETVELHYNIKS